MVVEFGDGEGTVHRKEMEGVGKVAEAASYA